MEYKKNDKNSMVATNIVFDKPLFQITYIRFI